MSARYQTPLGSTWFLYRPGYRRFMAREATSIAMGAFLIYLLFWLRRLGQGDEAFAAMVMITKHPISVVLHSLVFGAVLYHSFTWFNLTPKIMPLYVAEEKVPDVWAAIMMGYLPWLGVTVVILWGVLRQAGGDA